jgi:hypothetical protein
MLRFGSTQLSYSFGTLQQKGVESYSFVCGRVISKERLDSEGPPELLSLVFGETTGQLWCSGKG